MSDFFRTHFPQNVIEFWRAANWSCIALKQIPLESLPAGGLRAGAVFAIPIVGCVTQKILDQTVSVLLSVCNETLSLWAGNDCSGTRGIDFTYAFGRQSSGYFACGMVPAGNEFNQDSSADPDSCVLTTLEKLYPSNFSSYPIGQQPLVLPQNEQPSAYNIKVIGATALCVLSACTAGLLLFQRRRRQQQTDAALAPAAKDVEANPGKSKSI